LGRLGIYTKKVSRGSGLPTVETSGKEGTGGEGKERGVGGAAGGRERLLSRVRGNRRRKELGGENRQGNAEGRGGGRRENEKKTASGDGGFYNRCNFGGRGYRVGEFACKRVKKGMEKEKREQSKKYNSAHGLPEDGVKRQVGKGFVDRVPGRIGGEKGGGGKRGAGR